MHIEERAALHSWPFIRIYVNGKMHCTYCGIARKKNWVALGAFAL